MCSGVGGLAHAMDQIRLARPDDYALMAARARASPSRRWFSPNLML
jgi:hypothetical protein